MEEERAPTIYSLSKASCYCSAKQGGGANSQRGSARHRRVMRNRKRLIPSLSSTQENMTTHHQSVNNTN